MKGLQPGIRAVIFDVYGTLLDISKLRRPYRHLIELAAKRRPPIEKYAAARGLMSRKLGVLEAASWLGVSLTPAETTELDAMLTEELSSIRMFPDVVPAFSRLRNSGLKLALCSNLASPYVEPARLLLEPLVDTCVWSCEVGHLKPERAIFDIALNRLDVLAGDALMVGDNLGADIEGARAAGMAAVLLDRSCSRSDPRRISSLLGLIE